MPVEIYDTHEIQTAIKELNNLRDEVLFEDKHADPWEALERAVRTAEANCSRRGD